MRPALFFCILFFYAAINVNAQEPPDTVRVGIYITSIHNIDFKQKEYTMNLWLWMRYKNRELAFLENLEVPNSKTVEKSFTVEDTSRGDVRVMMKLQCVMRDAWKIGNFPFDRQSLWFAIENSQYDSRYMVFVPDTAGEHFDKRYTLRDWKIDSFVISAAPRVYPTAFGDETLPKQEATYSAFRTRIVITRESGGLFWKMFLGMYIAFLISYVCFFIHPDGMDSRFGLSVGALFAVIGNKYIIDSALPESTSFTLVDTLHGVTLFFILLTIICTIYSVALYKKNQPKKAKKFDMFAAQALMLLYLILNFLFISAARG